MKKMLHRLLVGTLMELTKEDRDVWLFIIAATFSVIILITGLVLTAGIRMDWIVLPVAWFIGAGMTWGYGKYVNRVK